MNTRSQKWRSPMRMEENEYGWCSSYTRLNIEFLHLLKSP
jgi:hypothetical protein